MEGVIAPLTSPSATHEHPEEGGLVRGLEQIWNSAVGVETLALSVILLDVMSRGGGDVVGTGGLHD